MCPEGVFLSAHSTLFLYIPPRPFAKHLSLPLSRALSCACTWTDSPHAIDMFPWIQPRYSRSAFNYSFTLQDAAFGELVQSRFVGFTASHAWPRVSNGGAPFVKNALPSEFVGIDFATGRDAGGTSTLKGPECAFWLAHGFYDSALIN